MCIRDRHLAVEQQAVALLPALHFLGGQCVEVDALGGGVGRPMHLRPFVQLGRFKEARPAAVQREMRVARGGAVGDHGNRLARRVAGRIHDLHVQNRGQTAQTLRANAQLRCV